jgi:hypothetical protein
MKLKSPHPSLRATLSPLGRGEGRMLCDVIFFSLSPPIGERAGGEGHVFIV